jgi:hypothetical protein
VDRLTRHGERSIGIIVFIDIRRVIICVVVEVAIIARDGASQRNEDLRRQAAEVRDQRDFGRLLVFVEGIAG